MSFENRTAIKKQSKGSVEAEKRRKREEVAGNFIDKLIAEIDNEGRKKYC